MNKRAVIYVRCASTEQLDEKLKQQIDECTEYAINNKIDVVNIYTERSSSGITDNRPEFLRMILDSEKGEFEIVLVSNISRFAHNGYISAIYKSKLKKNGVSLVSAYGNNYEGIADILLESVVEGFNEFYSTELSHKIRIGLKHNAYNGKSNGTHPPLGLLLGADKTLKVNPQTAPIVLEIMTRYDAGENMASIAKSLNERGLLTCERKPFTTKALAYILKNKKYIGVYKYNDVVIPHLIPAIVPEYLFDRVKTRLAKTHKPIESK